MDTRFLQVLEGLDAVLDVGGVYDPSLDRYDHHQKGFGEVFGHGFSTKLSSAGLVFRVFLDFKRQINACSQFGKEIIAKELQVNEGHPDVHRLFLAVYTSFMEVLSSAYIKELYMKLQDSMQCWTGAMWKVGLAWYHSNVDIFYCQRILVFHKIPAVRFVVFPFKNTLFYLLQATDAIDNGINQYDMDQPPRYVNSTHLSSRVGKLNLDWADPDQSPKKENEAFERAMALAGSEFLDVSFYFIGRVSFSKHSSIANSCFAAVLLPFPS
ncbi:hypothetical protein POTOM_000669 [Populus tomentosa]|uniref:Uncharacterized protein n=1 Tax=Populus tomentosa TaxID=118781 RepID=A0A8X8DGI6_POPTO|nr:hypothetical protein POTOM_000669 [Populus tomentosa]